MVYNSSVWFKHSLRQFWLVLLWLELVLLWLKPPLANDFCNFLNKIAKLMKLFVEVDLLKSYQPLCQH